jgi:hypothetical protein
MAEPRGDSPEAVAWQLLLTIARAEGVHLDRERGGWSKDQILAAYGECLAAVKGEAGERTAAGDAGSVELIGRTRYGANKAA